MACGWRAWAATGQGEAGMQEGASFGEAVSAGFALAAELRLAKRGGSVPVTVALPARCAVWERLTLPAGDPGELAGMVRLQFEKNLPYPIEETALGFQVLPRQSGGPAAQEASITVLAYAVHEAAAAALCAPLLQRQFPQRLTLWPLHVAEQSAEKGIACGLWREENDLVFGIFENRRPSFVEILGDRENPLAALPSVFMSAEMAGAPMDFQEILLDNTLSALGEPISKLLGASVRPLPLEFPALPPGETADLTPAAWRAQAARKERSRRLRKRVALAVALYAGLLIAAAACLGVQKERLAALQKQTAALQPQVDAVIDRQTRWKALAPAIEQRQFAVELLFQTCLSLPTPETRITRFEIARNQLLVEGEAPSAQQAIAFAERLKARPELSDYRFESSQPVLLPNEHAQFKIFGKQ